MYGDLVPLVVRCANPVCRALSDVDIRISEVAPPREPPGSPWIACDTPSGAARVRAPTGADDDATAEGTRADRAARLWSRLVLLDGRELDPDAWRALPAATRHAMALALAENGRAPELSYQSRCPTCAAGLEIAIEPFALLARELRAGGDRLYAEVHALAFHYHWSERDIFALPRGRRWRYLQLLARELEGRPLYDGWS
jgi:hypothetical protein